MINRILRSLTAFLDREIEKENELSASATALKLALAFAVSKNRDDLEAMREITRIAGASLQASDRSDCDAMNTCIDQLREFI